MSVLSILIKRNIKLFFKDKGMFFTALVTPAILLVLYSTFLGKIYHDTFISSLPTGVTVAEGLLDGLVGGQLMSSILAVSCVTVAFSANFLMVQDKVSGAIKDLKMSPVRSSVLSISYYIATLVSTLLICFAATGVCLGYIAYVGWYMSVRDVLLLFLDVFILSLFGTALSSLINMFLSTQGQMSAVGSIISAGYGFICGAYMPIATFSKGLQRVLMFLPGSYGTSLIRNHSLRGALAELQNNGTPIEAINGIKDSLDCNVYFFENRVSIPTMYIILGTAVAALLGAFIIVNACKRTKA